MENKLIEMNNTYSEILVTNTYKMVKAVNEEKYEEAAKFKKIINDLNKTMYTFLLFNTDKNNHQIKELLKKVTNESFQEMIKLSNDGLI